MNFLRFLIGKPDAAAQIRGSRDYPDINGTALFYQTSRGVIAVTQASGLPKGEDTCNQRIFALHIHSGSECSGDMEDPLKNALTHYNPYSCPHPHHAGDMPPLFGANGVAFGAFLTNRFTISEIIGKTIIIHSSPDDFTTQPAGNAGMKIACGVIKRV